MTLINGTTESGIALPSRATAIRTPVFGFVELDVHETWLINQPEIQRLRRIHQLAFSHYVYPGADHSRFLHTLSMLEIGTRIIDRMKRMAKEEPLLDGKVEWDEQTWNRVRVLFRLAAIFHDTGHGPFSHASEVDREGSGHRGHETNSLKVLDRYADRVDELFGEDTSRSLGILLDPERTPEQVAAGHPGLSVVNDLVDGPLDADKLAYLLDDSYFCGVTYGLYDHRRLIETSRAYTDEYGQVRQALEWGGLQVAEEVIMARVKMLVQVYFHRTRRSFDLIFANFLRELLDDGYPEDLDEYLAWDDYRVLTEAQSRARKGNGRGFGKAKPSEWARRIVDRDPLTTLFDPLTIKMDEEIAVTYTQPVAVLKKAVEEKYGEAYWKEHVSEDRAQKLPYVRLSQAGVIPLVATHRPPSTLDKESSIVRALTDEIHLWRIYSDAKSDEEVQVLRTTWVEALLKQQQSVKRILGGRQPDS
jgi:uncharacterized protein